MVNFSDNFWLILFIIWGLPLGYFRSKFRKLVYQTESWIINIKPVFVREIKALFGNLYPENKKYVKTRNLYRIYLAVYMLLFAAYFSLSPPSKAKDDMKKIIVGSTIPEFTLQDQTGTEFNIASLLGKKNLVIYFYPKDDTPGCTKQACKFRDEYEAFKDANAEVIGISSDDVESHRQFARKFNLNFRLLSDTENHVRELFGVPSRIFGLIPGRVTYVVNTHGVVIHLFDSQSEAERHISEAIDALRRPK